MQCALTSRIGPDLQAEAGQLQPALQHARHAVVVCGAAGAEDPGSDPNPSPSPSPALPWALAALVLSAQRRAELAADAAAAGLEARGRHAALLQRIRGRMLLQQGRLLKSKTASAASLACCLEGSYGFVDLQLVIDIDGRYVWRCCSEAAAACCSTEVGSQTQRCLRAAWMQCNRFH